MARLVDRLERVGEWLRQPPAPDWARPRPGTPLALALAALLVVAAAALSFESRSRQWEAWEGRPEAYFFSQGPLVTTTDAGYYLHRAATARDATVGAPLGTPLLSHVLRWTSDSPAIGDLLRAGHDLIAPSAVATALAVAVCFALLGFAAEGAVAGLAATVTSAALARSGVGRIDTDLLNAALLYGVLACFALAITVRRRAWVVAACAGAGAIHFVFWWWYHRPGFTLPLLAVLVAGLLVAHRDRLTAALGAAAFLVVGGPHQVLSMGQGFGRFVERWVAPVWQAAPADAPSGSLRLPPLHEMVGEAGVLDWTTLAMAVTGPQTAWLALVGVAGFALFAVTNPLRAGVLLPPVAFGVLALAGGMRFLAYAAPLLWFGIAFLASSAILAVDRRLGSPHEARAATVVVAVTMAGLLAAIWGTSGVRCRPEPADRCIPLLVPEPRFGAPLSDGLARLGERAAGQDAVLIGWWTDGYWAEFLTGMEVPLQPGAPVSEVGHLVGRALSQPDPARAAEILRFVASTPRAAMAPALRSPEAMRRAIARAPAPTRPVYLVLTDGMIDRWRAIERMGRWDGRARPDAVPPRTRADCRSVGRDALECGGERISLETGRGASRGALDALLVTDRGRLSGMRDFEGEGDRSLLMSQPGRRGRPADFTLLDPALSRSVLAQLLLFDRVDPASFRRIDDGYPHYRIFAVRPGDAEEGGRGEVGGPGSPSAGRGEVGGSGSPSAGR